MSYPKSKILRFFKLLSGWWKLKFSAKRRRRKQKIAEGIALPESQYEATIARIYKDYTGYDMDFANPKTYSQKQQWLKLYDQSELKTQLSDKYAVRDFIRRTVGDKYLVPLCVIDGKDHFYKAEEIDFSQLPKSFVLKCNHGCGYNIVVKDKDELSSAEVRLIKQRLNDMLSEKYEFVNCLELVYKGIKPCIVAEQYIGSIDQIPNDYKFLCFNGEVKYLWCDMGRAVHHTRSIYDLAFNRLPFTINVFPPNEECQKPKHLDEMIAVAKKLCVGFSHVRVDLYSTDEGIYFGEMTFSSSSGLAVPNPPEYDVLLGDMLPIDTTVRDRITKYRLP